MTDITKEVVARLRELATVKLDEDLRDTTGILIKGEGWVSYYNGICIQVDEYFCINCNSKFISIRNNECIGDYTFEDWLCSTKEYDRVRVEMVSWYDLAAWNDLLRLELCATLADKIEREGIEFWIR